MLRTTITSLTPRVACFPLVFMLTLIAPAGAEDARSGAEARARADRLCAAYGPGFVASSLGQCGRVEERLRVNRNPARGMSAMDAPMGFAPLASGDSMPAHLRLNGGFGATQQLGRRN